MRGLALALILIVGCGPDELRSSASYGGESTALVGEDGGSADAAADAAACDGCIAPDGSCVNGPQAEACGSHGDECMVCDDGNPCTNDECSADGTCSYAPLSGTQCSAFPKKFCNDGSCS